jgi:uncharacterized protein YjdB
MILVFFVKGKETSMLKNSIRLFVAGALLAGCTPQVAKLEVTPANVTLHKVDQIAALKMTATDASGKAVQKPQVNWTSADPAVATVDATGTVTAKKSGTTNITVQAGQVVAEVPVTVAIYSALKVNPEKLELKVGEKGTLQAQILDEKGAPLPGAVTWMSENEKLAKVDAQGHVEAVAPGTAKLMAHAQDLKATVDVTVAAAGPQKGGKKGKK